MKAIIFDAFGTLFKVTNGGSARTIRKYIIAAGNTVEEAAFLEEWKAYYKKHTGDECEFMTEREIFIARIRMFYDRYGVSISFCFYPIQDLSMLSQQMDALVAHCL